MSESSVSNAADFVGVVVAAGSSRRFRGTTPKQFLDLGSGTLIERSIAALSGHRAVRGVVVVMSEEHRRGAAGEAVAAREDVIAVVRGGETRAASARAGVEAAGDSPFVLVHDAARPLAGAALVDAVVRATRRHGAAIPGLVVADTVKRVEARGEDVWIRETLDRGQLRAAQTPQGARTAWLRDALVAVLDRGTAVTDEAAALELCGRRVAVVPGDPRNVKITAREDLERARRDLADGAPELRIGSGFDIHRFGGDRPLMLAGVRFEGEPGLSGHSDADVALHAAMDAVLGAAALGDIGALFPPDDARYAGADSRVLAQEVAARVARSGWVVVNLDLTLLAERPRIRDRVPAMQRAVAACFRIDAGRVGVKATTLERLGALGRAEGVACQAVALLRAVR